MRCSSNHHPLRAAPQDFPSPQILCRTCTGFHARVEPRKKLSKDVKINRRNFSENCRYRMAGRDPVFVAHRSLRGVGRGLFETVAVAVRSGNAAQPGHRPLDFPEHPDQRAAEADHDNQEHHCQCGCCHHVQHPPMQCGWPISDEAAASMS